MDLKLILSTEHLRRYACEKSVFLFAMYYLRDFFKLPSARFHKEWARDMRFEKIKNFINLGHRESSKTSWTKFKILHSICYGHKKFVVWVSYDQKKAENNLFDIAFQLQHNVRIVRDFGLLFKGDKQDKHSVEKKSIKDFVTSNGIKVLSYGTKGTLRGVVFNEHRPDLLIFDDIENNETKKSSIKTRSIIEFIDETLAGLQADANIIVCANYISEFGVIRYLLDKADRSEQWKVSWQNVENNGVVNWTAKYAMTNKEAQERNAKLPKHLHVISLEEKKAELGERVYDQEMMNKPIVYGERFFNTDKVDARIAAIKAADETVVDNLWKRWGKPVVEDINTRGHLYAIGADIGQGVQADSSVVQVFDFTENRQVAELESNNIDPREIGCIMVAEALQFGNCIVCPENNSIGGETIREIQAQGYNNLYVNVTHDKINNKYTNSFGWNTNSVTKSAMLINFRDEFEKGLIEINSLPLLYEMRAFTRSNLKIESIYDENISNHFDRVIAMSVTLMMRKHVTPVVSAADAMKSYYDQL